MSSEKLIAVAVGLMNQYQEYAKANGITQTDVASILAFLSQGGNPAADQRREAENLVKNSVDSEYYPKQIRDLLMQDVVAAYPGVCQGIIPFRTRLIWESIFWNICRQRMGRIVS